MSTNNPVLTPDATELAAEASALQISMQNTCQFTPSTVFLDKVQLHNHFRADRILAMEAVTTGTKHLLPHTLHGVFDADHFRISGTSAYVRVGNHKTFGSNGANSFRASAGLPTSKDNQLTPQEKALLVQVSNGDGYKYQIANITDHLSGVAARVYKNWRALPTDSNVSLPQAEFYIELPLPADPIEKVRADLESHIGPLFGEFDLQIQTGKRAEREGDPIRWKIRVRNKRNRDQDCYIKVYRKGDHLRIEVRFVSFPLPKGWAGNSYGGLKSTLIELGDLAKGILHKIEQAMQMRPVVADVAVLQDVLRALSIRNVHGSRQIEKFIAALARFGRYTPSLYEEKMQVGRGVLAKVSDPLRGFMEQDVLPGINGKGVKSFKLHPNWLPRVQAIVIASKLSDRPESPVAPMP